MGDYISRDVTYTLAKRINDKIINGEYHAATFGGVILDMIDELPAADVVERKTGKIKIMAVNPFDGEDCYCSECEHWGLLPDYQWCPYCGVKLEGVER